MTVQYVRPPEMSDPSFPTEPGRDPGRAPGRVPGRPARPLGPREVGLVMTLWTALMGGWFVWTAAGSTFPTSALALAVLALFAVVWLVGLLILGLFLVAGE